VDDMMTVALGYRDAVGNAGKRPVSGRSRGVAGGAPPLPARSAQLGPLGSRFWALSEEDSDAEEEVVSELDGRADPGRFSSPRSPPTQRTLDDFLGEEWFVVQPAGRRRSGVGSEGAPVSGSAAAPTSEEISSDLCVPAVPSDADFPPLGRSAIPVGTAVPTPQVLVGSVSISLQGTSLFSAGRPPAARMDPVLPGVWDEGVVAHSQSRDPGGMVDPPRQCLAEAVPVYVGVARGPVQVAQSGPLPRPGPFVPQLYKWAWRPVGTLDLNLLIPTSIPDLTRASLLHLTVSAPRIF
jgi:hypothetical protein